MNAQQLKFPSILLYTGLAAGLVADLLLYKQPLGVSIPIIAVVLVAALLGLAFKEEAPLVWANLWLILPLLFLAGMSAVRAEPTLRFINIAGSLALGILLANRLATRPLAALNAGSYGALAAEAVLVTPIIPAFVLAQSARGRKETNPNNRRIIGRVLVGVLIAVPFLLIFTLLFASADLVFSNLVGDLLEAINLQDIIGHTILTGVLGWLAVGGLAYALTRPQDGRTIFSGPPAEGDQEKPTETNGGGLRSLLGTVESAVALFSINALFVVFVVIQFAALFGGEEFLRSQGLTYSEYARRGFFELLAVSLITLGLILVLDFVTRRETRRQYMIFLLGSGLMIVMAIIILASAYQRLQLYEVAYGFTRMRVYPHVFMIWLAVLFALFGVMLFFKRTEQFANGALAAALGFAISMNILNPDVFIFQQNMMRYERDQGRDDPAVEEALDVAYLGTLSEDAVPQMVTLLESDDPEVRDTIGPWLRTHLDRLDARAERAGWPAYHLSIDQAYRALNAHRDEIEQYEPAYPIYGFD